MQPNATQLNEFSKIADEELLRLRAALDIEMRKRKLAFSVGEIGEQLVVEYFKKTSGCPNLQHAPRGTKNVDALSRAGDRYSIKTVCKGKKTGTIYPDSENREKALFEYLLIVRLDEELKLIGVYRYDWSDFCAVRCWDKRMTAWYVPVTKRALEASTIVYESNASPTHASKS